MSETTWKTAELGELGTILTGSTPPTKNSEYFNGKVPFVSPSDLGKRKYISEAQRTLSELGFREAQRIPTGSVLVTCIGSTIGKIGIAATPLATNQQINSLIPNQMACSEFVFYQLQRLAPLLRKLAGCQAVPIINKSTLSSIAIKLPSLAEQNKIAEILTCWDKAIELVERLIEEKRQVKRAWSQRLLIGKYHLGAENEGSKWKTLSAEEIFTVRSERKHGDKPVLSVTQDQGVVIRNSLDRRIAMTESDPNNFKLVRKGDFVISLRSFQGGLECSDIEGIVSPAYHVIYPKIPISQSYFRHLFKSYWFIGHLATAVIGIRDGKQISFQDFEFMELPFPPIEEQERIGRFMDALDVEQSLLNEQLNALTDQKRGLMQKLLTGKIRVKV